MCGSTDRIRNVCIHRKLEFGYKLGESATFVWACETSIIGCTSKEGWDVADVKRSRGGQIGLEESEIDVIS